MRFSTHTDRDSTGSPRLRMLDQIRLGRQQDSTGCPTVFGFPCRSGDEVNPWVFGFLTDPHRKKQEPIRAWRANPETGRFEEMICRRELCNPPYVAPW